MSIVRTIFAAILMTGTGSAQAQAQGDFPPEVIAAIQARFAAYQQAAHAPGVVWGIVKDGRLAHVGTLGVQNLATQAPVTADSVFRIASMSKAFTALAVLKLREQGKVDLDSPASRYVPELAGLRYPTGDSPPIRVQDLLGHVGGFVTDDPWGDRQQPMSEEAFTSLLRGGVSFTRAPRTAYEYSNLGYALLGRIVTNVSGSRYDRYIEREIMGPLGMAASGYEIGDVPADKLAVGYRWENEAFAQEPSMPHGVFGAMGGVHTSARDYARWVAFLLSAWPPRDGPEAGPATRATVRQLGLADSTPRLAERPRPAPAGPCPQAAVYGAGFHIIRDCDLGFVLTHNGGYPGYGSTLILMPDAGIGIFAFVNRTYGGPSVVGFEAAQILKDAGLLVERPVPVSPELAAAYKLAGSLYRAGSLAPAGNNLAMNFLMDRSAENWTKEFARIKGEAGECAADEPVTATGLLTGQFSWTCAKGKVEGTLLLSPTNPPRIQALRLRAVPTG